MICILINPFLIALVFQVCQVLMVGKWEIEVLKLMINVGMWSGNQIFKLNVYANYAYNQKQDWRSWWSVGIRIGDSQIVRSRATFWFLIMLLDGAVLILLQERLFILIRIIREWLSLIGSQSQATYGSYICLSYWWFWV